MASGSEEDFTTMMMRIISILVLLTSSLAWAAEPVMFARRPLDAWLADLDDADPLVREEALEVVTQLGPKAKPAVPKLERLAKAASEAERRRAAMALWKVDGRADAAIPVFRAALKGATGLPRVQTIQTLRDLGVPADELAPHLIDGLADPDFDARNQATVLLRGMATEVMPVLIEEIPKARGDKLQHVLSVLSGLGPRGKEALPALNNLLKDSDPAVKMAGVRAVLVLDRGNRAAHDVLSEVAQSKDAVARRQAFAAALQIFPRSADLAPIFRAGLAEKDPGARLLAAQALWDVDKTSLKDVLPILIDDLKQPNRAGVRPSVGTLGQIGPDAKAAIPALAALLKKPEESGSYYMIVYALGRMGPDALPALGEAVRSPNARYPAIEALIAHGAKGMAMVEPLLKDGDAVTRRTAADAAARFGRAAAAVVPQLAELLRDPDVSVRRSAAVALGAVGPSAKAAAPALAEFAKDESQPAFYRATAVESLGRIGPDAKPAAETIRGLMKDGDATLRFRAAEALMAIEGKSDEVRAALLDMLQANAAPPAMLPQLVAALDAAGVAGREVIPALAERLKNPDPQRGNFMPRQIAVALANHYGEEPDAVPLLTELLKQDEPEVKYTAALVLARHGAAGKAAVPALLERAKRDANFAVAPDPTLAALGALGPHAAAAFDDLMEIWKKPNAFLLRRFLLAETLAKIDRAKAKPALDWLEQQALPAAGVNGQAAICLARADPKNAKVLPAALKLLDMPNKFFVGQALELLALVGPDAKSTLPRARAALTEPTAQVRVRAAVAVWKITGEVKDALPVLTAAVSQADTLDVPPGAVGPIVPPRSAAQAAAQALGEMGAAAKSALPALREAQALNDTNLRSAAAAAIHKIEAKKP
jgi:HEAT repeat protein